MKKHVLLKVDLKDDADLIREYEHLHTPGNVPIEVLQSIQAEGFVKMDIYRLDKHLFMIAEIDSTQVIEPEAIGCEVLAEWNQKMAALQQHEGSPPDWKGVKHLFSLEEHLKVNND